MTSWGVFVAPKTIKPTSEIYRIDFLFVTDFYCLYDICMKKVEAFQTFIYRCNMWMLLIVKLLSFKRYNYPFYKCRENEQQM